LAISPRYGNSGIMTFMVNHDGVVFQKDLGPVTGKIARKIESFSQLGWAPLKPNPAGKLLEHLSPRQRSALGQKLT
jgi:hypothetical protein